MVVNRIELLLWGERGMLLKQLIVDTQSTRSQEM